MDEERKKKLELLKTQAKMNELKQSFDNGGVPAKVIKTIEE